MPHLISIFLLTLSILLHAKEEQLQLWALDSKTQKPVPNAVFEITVTTQDRKEKKFTAKANQNGEALIKLPFPSTLYIIPKAKDYINEFIFGGATEHQFTPEKEHEILKVEMTKGITVTGTVFDQKTGKPIPNATVAPLAFFPPIFQGDSDREVKADNHGKFTLPHVDPQLGITASHPDYYANEKEYGKTLIPDKNNIAHKNIRLISAPRVTGKVVTSEGKPISGAVVDNGSIQHLTDQNGQFTIRMGAFPHEKEHGLSIRKTGYLDLSESFPKTQKDNLTLTLHPLPLITGKVLDPQGNPVKNYTLRLTPGKYLKDYDSTQTEIKNPDGNFQLPLKKKSAFTVSIMTEDHPPLHQLFPVSHLKKPLTLKLQKPAQATLSFRLPKNFTKPPKIEVHRLTGQKTNIIIGDNDGSSYLEKTPHQVTKNQITLPRLSPDQNYLLVLHHPELTPIQIPFKTNQTSLTIPTITLQKRGTITGQVFDHMEKDLPWAMADGKITIADLPHNFKSRPWAKPIEFKADENGKFTIKNVPSGKIDIVFHYWLTADILDGLYETASVTPGKTAHVIVKPEANEDEGNAPVIPAP